MPGGKNESSGQTQKLERSRVHEGGDLKTIYYLQPTSSISYQFDELRYAFSIIEGLMGGRFFRLTLIQSL